MFFSGANVYMVCRNKERGEAAQSKIQSDTGNQNVHLEVYMASFLLSYLFIRVPFKCFIVSRMLYFSKLCD